MNMVWRIWAVLLAVLLVACARGLNERAPPTDQLLSATVFQMRYADTPWELAELKRMTHASTRAPSVHGYAPLCLRRRNILPLSVCRIGISARTLSAPRLVQAPRQEPARSS